MVQVYRRQPGPGVVVAHHTRASGDADQVRAELELAREELGRLRTVNAELQIQLQDETRLDGRVARLRSRLKQAHLYAQRAKEAAGHWFGEAHRVANGQELQHRTLPCTTCSRKGA